MKDLYDLLRQYPAATLASAVERFGIEGRDNFGRQGKFKPGSPEATEALAALAAQYRWEQSDIYEQSPADDLVEWSENPFLRYGWHDDTLPDFSPLDAAPKRTGAETKVNDTVLTIIAALAVEVGIDLRTPSATSDLLKLMQSSDFTAPSENTLCKVVFDARDAIGRRSK